MRRWIGWLWVVVLAGSAGTMATSCGSSSSARHPDAGTAPDAAVSSGGVAGKGGAVGSGGATALGGTTTMARGGAGGAGGTGTGGSTATGTGGRDAGGTSSGSSGGTAIIGEGGARTGGTVGSGGAGTGGVVGSGGFGVGGGVSTGGALATGGSSGGDAGTVTTCSCAGGKTTLECFCKVFSCERTLASFTVDAGTSSAFSTLEEYANCDLVVVTVMNSIAPWVYVFDRSTGQLVGEQYNTDAAEPCRFGGDAGSYYSFTGGLLPDAACVRSRCMMGSLPGIKSCPDAGS